MQIKHISHSFLGCTHITEAEILWSSCAGINQLYACSRCNSTKAIHIALLHVYCTITMRNMQPCNQLFLLPDYNPGNVMPAYLYVTQQQTEVWLKCLPCCFLPVVEVEVTKFTARVSLVKMVYSNVKEAFAEKRFAKRKINPTSHLDNTMMWGERTFIYLKG